MEPQATLYFMCGKMAAGKSTLARRLAAEKHAVLLVQDEFLEALYPGEIRSIADFVRSSARVRAALSQHVRELLQRGVPVVLDFPGNTRSQRHWFRHLIDSTGVAHELHFLDVPDQVCKQQLRKRSAGLPAGSAWTTDEEFESITAFFEPPDEDEGFTVVAHRD